ncbi:hypothetical protein GE09DRAFT_500479 [Coniochaeta sp. 2T2.1]|nr:hypothetical protein GE09DRAFT_500479 [Coniochaeta sp. 2T2.1]
MEEVELHLQTLRTLRSSRTGGPSGIVCPPKRATQYFPNETVWSVKVREQQDFVFCHCDLSQSNIIVDPVTLKIQGIIDWEYEGFWPDYFETPYFRDPGLLVPSSGTEMRMLGLWSSSRQDQPAKKYEQIRFCENMPYDLPRG